MHHGYKGCNSTRCGGCSARPSGQVQQGIELHVFAAVPPLLGKFLHRTDYILAWFNAC